MPFRPQQLDTGFSAYQQKQEEPIPTQPSRKLGDIGYNVQQIGKEFQELGATMGAAFRMENDVLNVVSLMTRPSFPADPSFNVAARLKEDGLWNDYSDNFIGVDNEQEYLAVSGRIAQEEKDRATLASAGMAGFVGQMAAGMLSPTTLLPFVGGARGAKAIAIGAGMGFAGGGLQEIPLQLAQETRTMEESVSSIALSTVLGGALGGAVAFARRKPEELADLLSSGMVPEPGSSAIPTPRSAGAAARLEQAPELASAMGLEQSVGQISPVVRVLTGTLDQGRWMMAKLADAGLEFKDRAVAAVGGNVENRIKTYYGPVAKVIGALDDAWARYWFEGAPLKPLAAQRASLASLNPNRTKLAKNEFKQEIARALQNGDRHEIPEVQEIAQMLRKEIYDPILKQAEEVGLLKTKDGETPPGDLSYLNRVYNIDLIQMRQPEFEAILANHYEQKVAADFQQAYAKLTEDTRRLELRAEDFSRPEDEVKELREQFEAQLRALDEGRDEDLVELEDTITDRRSTARSLPSGSAERAAALDEARALEQEGGEALAATRAERAEIKRRLKNLRQAHSNLTARQEAKLSKVARAEELSLGTLQRLVRRGQKVLGELDKLSDAKLDAELSKLKNQFADAAARYDRNEDRIAKIFDDDFEGDVPTSPFAQAAKVETEAFAKMSDVAEVIDELEVFDRVVARDAILAGLEDATRRAQGIVERRAVRTARLADQAKALDPEAAAKRIEDTRGDARLRRQEFMDSWRERGADDIDPASGAANFKRFAADIARQTTNKILGTYMRLPGVDMILQPHGAELARTLDIDSNLLRGADGLSFLEQDVEKLMMTYVRTMAPDIELHRAFGDFAPDMELNENWKKLDDEYNARLGNELKLMQEGVDPKTGKPKTFTQEQMDKRAKTMADEYGAIRRDLEAVIGRLRHTWGVPKDPRGFGARAARVASNVNVLRMMGGVVVSSIPDLARPIMKYGLLNTFRNGYVPFVKGLANLNFTPRQLKIAGAALDVTLHSRAAQIYDIGDYMVRGSKFEKGLDAATSKIGLIALFDYWTTAMKQISGSVANARAMDAVNIVAGGAKASQRDLDEAVRFLAANGIDDDFAIRILNESRKPGGGEEVNGVWWPNTEAWTDQDAVRAYNAMLVREVDNSIITPGVERPLMTDANPYQKLLFQFKSFGMSSTTKTFLAGAQGMKQGDMAFVMGGVISLALGSLSYYTYANIVGGTVKEKMESALAKGKWELFADEAINRSGLLGVGADLQSAFAATPLAPYTTFSGERSTRRGGDNLWETVVGPTVGDLGPRAANLTYSLGKAGTTGQAGDVAWADVRRLAPFQNHFMLRQFYDMIEAAAGQLPESKE